MPTADRKEREKVQRRDAILDAAERLFFSRGYDNVSMDEIAKDVELAKGTLYLYFKNKDSLFFAIALRRARCVHEMMAECAQSRATGREKSRRMGECFFEFARQNQDYYRMACAVAPALLRKADSDGAKKEVIDLMVKDLRLHRDVLREGMEDGTVRPDLDPLEMAVYINIMSMSVICLDPSWKKGLQEGGISYSRFVKDFLLFLGNAVDKRQDEDGTNMT